MPSPNWSNVRTSPQRRKSAVQVITDIIQDVLDIAITPFRLIFDILLKVLDLSWRYILKGMAIGVLAPLLLYTTYTGIRLIHYLADEAALSRERVEIEIEQKVEKEISTLREELTPVLNRADRAYSDLQEYKAHQVYSIYYKVPKKPNRAMVMNGSQRGQVIKVE